MRREEMLRHITRKTRFGPVAILWEPRPDRPAVRRILLSKPQQAADAFLRTQFPGSIPSSCARIDELAERIAAFFDGVEVSFSLAPMQLDRCPPFQRRVLLAEYGIPRGRVSTYGRIAACLGVPGGARAVGHALAANPFPVVIPCHRAIRSDGTLGGYQGGLAMKRILLGQEGVEIDDRGRVISPDLYY